MHEFKMGLKLLIFSFYVLFISSVGLAQDPIYATMYFYEDNTLSNPVLPEITIKADSAKLNKSIDQQLINLYESGYLSASYKVNIRAENRYEIAFVTNQVFRVAHLNQGNVNDEILNKIGFDSRSFSGKPFSYKKITGLLNSILDYAENHGYPFASVRLDSIQIADSEIYGWLNYQSGPLIIFDSLAISGYDKIKSGYLMTHLGIYKEAPYDERLVKEIPNKMKLLPFLRIYENPTVEIVNGKCVIYLNLSPNKISKFDGILGVLPNQKGGDELLITGQLDLDLYNLFSSGKRIALEWQGFDANSQLLDVLYYHPNLFRTPLNIEGDFFLLKQDTTFINRKFGLKISLIAKNSSKIGFRTEFHSSRLISISGFEDVMELPENVDYNITYYGLDYLLNRFNDPDFPTRGWSIAVNGSVGQKKIIENPAFNDEVFTGIDLNNLQIKVSGEVEKYWVLYKNLLFRSRLLGGYLEGDNLFRSDLFRIGGLRSLRGFVENQFFTSMYGIANLEFRSVFSKDTFFFAFFDQAMLKEDFEYVDGLRYPFGAGAGFSFTSDAGVFSFVFAMGKSSDQPFGIQHSKIHFGYVSRF
ncbi:MAG: BamA/TamA family outer membrane protein [Cytophagales bacterium]|nr:BamA/TamA family outer membrane protein [Cytophagales bacterium]